MTRVRSDHDGERCQARAPGRDLKRDRALSRRWLGRRGGDEFQARLAFGRRPELGLPTIDDVQEEFEHKAERLGIHASAS